MAKSFLRSTSSDDSEGHFSSPDGYHQAEVGSMIPLQISYSRTRRIAVECIMSPAYNEKDRKSEDNTARLCAELLKMYSLGINNLYTHTHWLNVRDGKTGNVDNLNTMRNNYKMCPLYILPHWAEFKAKVQSYLGENAAPKPAPKQLYRVRKSWSDVKSQIGAFSSLDNAKRACKDGFTVYDVSGNAVYSNTKSVDTIAREVISGKWGNGSDRKNRLTAAGYDYSAVQRKVNELMK